MNVTEEAKGTPIGRRDANGKPIHVGDVLDFDADEWGEPMQFTVELVDGEISHPGAPSDLSQWCRIVKEWNSPSG